MGGKEKVVILGGKGESTKIIYHSIKNNFDVEKVIIEDEQSKIKFLKYRINKLGIFTVLGQLIFNVLIINLLKIFFNTRIEDLQKKFNFNKKEIPKNKIIMVSSVNADYTRNLIKNVESKIIIVSGTRIIGKKTLNASACKFINIHAGITPKYRGVHGAYWALVNKDESHCGVTLHYVDKGVDTGVIIEQSLIKITNKDCFITYPIIQLNSGIHLLKKSLNKIINDKQINTRISNNLPSSQFYHPTVSTYLYNYVFLGVK